MRRRTDAESNRFFNFCKKWGILKGEIVLLSEEETDFDEQVEINYEETGAEGGGIYKQ